MRLHLIGASAMASVMAAYGPSARVGPPVVDRQRQGEADRANWMPTGHRAGEPGLQRAMPATGTPASAGDRRFD